jgi:hypothetical protein
VEDGIFFNFSDLATDEMRPLNPTLYPAENILPTPPQPLPRTPEYMSAMPSQVESNMDMSQFLCRKKI